jgi:hypothetical protein
MREAITHMRKQPRRFSGPDGRRELLHFLFQRFAINARVSVGPRHEDWQDRKASAVEAATVGFMTPAALSVKATAQGGLARGASLD